METTAHREACKRQHRIVAHYLAVQAWIRRLDCIVLDRKELEAFLGLEKFKSVRVAWLRADMKPWFPYQVAYHQSDSPSSIHSLFLSRVPIERYLSWGSLTTPERIKQMPEGSPSTEKFSTGGYKVPSEKEIVSMLAVMAAGLDTPRILEK